MDRRRFVATALAAVLAGGPAPPARAHTPYNQWVIYRRRHLLILTSRADPRSYPLGKVLAGILSENLPASRARPSRAPDSNRIASLISTKQMEVALLTREEAVALLRGREPFRDYGPVPLRALFEVGDYLLVARSDFPAAHAYLVAATLDANRAALGGTPGAVPGIAGTFPVHAGVIAYSAGIELATVGPATPEPAAAE